MVLAGLLVMLAATSSSPVPLDSVAVIARARALHPLVSAGDAGALWTRFDSSMRAAMKDSANFAGLMSGIHAQVGAIDSVLSEQVLQDRGRWIYRALCRFTGIPLPARLVVGFAPDGRIGSLAVQPPERPPFPSPFLDYQTRTKLSLPFAGEWFVFWGGRTLEQNHHAASRSQRFAHDLAIRKDGRTHAGDGKKLEDYHCYGLPVLAPAAGTVVWLEDGHPDQAIGSSDRDQPIGNGVIIDHGQGEYSLLAHFQPGSITVKKGDPVRQDQAIARCGNSGNTSEPHLHFHLQNGPTPEDVDGLPAFFVDLVVDGQEVERGEIVRGQMVRRKGTK